jgi:hypothetical protein
MSCFPSSQITIVTNGCCGHDVQFNRQCKKKKGKGGNVKE